jgi:phytanoyl-CoA hydroxylase
MCIYAPTHTCSRTSDDYFLGSGDKIRFFWEVRFFESVSTGSTDVATYSQIQPQPQPPPQENAFNPQTGDFQQPRAASINKVGHALHDLDPVFQKATYTPQVGKIARCVYT